jgi:hypothetical protein
MQTNTILKLIPITFVAAGLFLGCGEAYDHEHTDGDGHDHDGDNHDGHDHGDGGHQENVAATDDYPLTTCLVDDSNKLGSMGKAFVHVHEGITVKFCCEGCLDEFNEAPKKFLAKLEAAKKGELPKPAPKGEEKPEAEETQPAPKETESENN